MPKRRKLRQLENGDAPTPAVLAQRAVSLAVVGYHYGITPGSQAAVLATHPDAEWLIGRLWLTGHISAAQRDAAKKLAMAARRYEGLLLAPCIPDSIALLEPRGLSTESEEAYGRRFRRARATYERFYRALTSAGASAHRAVTFALRNEKPDLGDLRNGLNALLTLDRKGA